MRCLVEASRSMVVSLIHDIFPPIAQYIASLYIASLAYVASVSSNMKYLAPELALVILFGPDALSTLVPSGTPTPEFIHPHLWKNQHPHMLSCVHRT